MWIRKFLNRFTAREKTIMKSSIGNIILGVLSVPWGLDIIETGVVGKYEKFPAFEFTGWAFAGVGILFIVFGLYRLLACLFAKK